ncbi:MAG: hypothetical protein ACC613_00205 [Synergistales bacterium]
MGDKWADLIKDLEDLREEGEETVPVERLIKYLKRDQEEEVKREEGERFYERLKCEVSIEEFRQRVSTSIEMFRSVLTLGHNALRATFLLNGTASISLLTFLGNIWAKSPGSPSNKALAMSLLFFSIGAFFSVVATCFTWCSQDRYAAATKVRNEHPADERRAEGYVKWGHRSKAAAIVTGVISLILFLFGIGAAIKAFWPVP